ncbi:hypothetical protein [Pendulispora albinea]|uniref:Uncharacterized protein n=1 Tax=Pendulispora albinea TaxID=2741071 RepID=A0ABZ2LWS9_9BACT
MTEAVFEQEPSSPSLDVMVWGVPCVPSAASESMTWRFKTEARFPPQQSPKDLFKLNKIGLDKLIVRIPPRLSARNVAGWFLDEREELLELLTLLLRIMERARGQLPLAPSNQHDTKLSESDAPAAPTKDDWQIVRSNVASMNERIEALSRLSAEHDPRLARFLVNELRKDEIIDMRWLEILVQAVEQQRIASNEDRASLVNSLWRHAFTLRDATDSRSEPALWSALRQLGSMAPADVVEQFIKFMRPEDPPKTRQTALQSVQNMFSVQPPRDDLPLGAISARAIELVEKYLDPDMVSGSENMALGYNAFLVAALVGSTEAPRFAKYVTKLGRAWLTRRTESALRDTLARWRAHGITSRAERVLKECLDVLSSNV